VVALKAAAVPNRRNIPSCSGPGAFTKWWIAVKTFPVSHIMIKPGERISLCIPHHSTERWGGGLSTARATCGEKVQMRHENQPTFIPVGCEKHRLGNACWKCGVSKFDRDLIWRGGIVRYDDFYGCRYAGVWCPVLKQTLPFLSRRRYLA
jgi:hypothetical protein